MEEVIKVTFLTLSVIHRELEKQRTITSMPLAEERQILKEINYTKKQKLQLDEYNAIDKEIQEKRVRRGRFLVVEIVLCVVQVTTHDYNIVGYHYNSARGIKGPHNQHYRN